MLLWPGNGGEVTITGGHVTATGAGGAVGSYAPPIGGLTTSAVTAEIVGVELDGVAGPWAAGAPGGGTGVAATITATGAGFPFTITTSITETVIAFTTGLALTSAPTAAEVGDTITVTASVLDYQGQPLADVSSRMTLHSSVATDIIAGNTVTFPSASPHTITASFGGHTATVTVEVAAAPSATLAATGTDSLPIVLSGSLLVLLGGSLAALARRRGNATVG